GWKVGLGAARLKHHPCSLIEFARLLKRRSGPPHCSRDRSPIVAFAETRISSHLIRFQRLRCIAFFARLISSANDFSPSSNRRLHRCACFSSSTETLVQVSSIFGHHISFSVFNRKCLFR